MMGNGYGHNMMENGYNMIGGWFGMMIIFLILIGVIVYVVFKQNQNNNGKDIGTRDNSLNILNERLARGDINVEEYNQKKDIILKH